MNTLTLNLASYEQRFKIKGVPRHELAASVKLITDELGITKKYSFAYWCGRVKRSKKSFGEVEAIIKLAGQLPGKYSKGGYISNQLK